MDARMLLRRVVDLCCGEKLMLPSVNEASARTHIIKPEHVPDDTADAARVEHPLPRAGFNDETEQRIGGTDANRAAEVSRDELAALIRRNPFTGECVHSRPRHASDETLQQSKSDHPTVVKVAAERHHQTHNASDEVRETEDELRAVLGCQDTTGQLRH